MKKYIFPIIIATITFASCIKDRGVTASGPIIVQTGGDSLIHYWNCNASADSTLANNIRIPTKSKVAGATWTYAGAYYDTVQPGTNINAVGADSLLTSGNGSLRLRNPASGPFTLSLPTTGYKNIVLKFAEERTSKGASTNTVTYTVDGTNYISTAVAAIQTYNVDTVFGLHSFDFSSDAMVNNNPNFKVRISFGPGATNTTGNDRFDNITVYGVKQ